jgi:magnesium-transporting ATPase (P-type)
MDGQATGERGRGDRTTGERPEGDEPTGERPAGERLDPEERIDRLFRHLGTSRSGLSAREARRRLEQHGPNEIERRRGPSHVRDLARQFTHPLALLLWVAAALAAATGVVPLAAAIVGVIVLNAVFAFTQELQAERATEALREYLPPQARVRRGGEEVQVDATTLVPGDLLLIGEGDRLCADARLIEGYVEVDASPLTGESQPVARTARRSRLAGSPLESEDLVFSGTLCTEGEAEAVVYATGMATQLGRIAALSQRIRTEVSPLQVQVNRVAVLIAAIAVAAGVLFFAIGTTIAGLSLGDSVTFAIGLLVANVPEGLLPTITLALAVGVRRMARRRALVKRLTAVETLGSTDVICTDKTGTLTEGRMSVHALWAEGEELRPGTARAPVPDLAATANPASVSDASILASREPFSALLRTALRCNNAAARRETGGWRREGDPGESALLVAAAALGEDVESAQAERDAVRRAIFHFDPRLKRMTTLDEEPGGRLWYHTKGAPLELLERCGSIRGRDGDRPLSAADRSAVEEAFERYASLGMRVLGFAERRAAAGGAGEQPAGDPAPQRGSPGARAAASAAARESAEAALTFVGLVVLEDPLRPEVVDSVARCRRAGVRIIVVTGDHGLTATAVAREAGIVSGEPTVLSGTEVDAMPERRLDRLLTETEELIVARSNPETKLHLVEALEAEGHTVAMTGDGVNDAPALRRADIGVAMGESGTDVARETATMVLADDNFASIAAAIEEGRVVYENIRKFITYIFAHTTPEVVPFLLFALSGGTIPLPLTALQILAIDLGTETLPALALGREPAEPGILDRPPRPRSENIVQGEMLTRAWLWLGLLEAALVLAGFFVVLTDAGWSPGDPTGTGSPLHDAYLAATTMTFAGITACQVGTAFAARTSRASLRRIGPLSNPLLLWGIGFELVFAAALVYLPPLQDVFGTAAISPAHLALLLPFPFIVWGTDELRRWALRRRA